jgi:hypothetical protein
MVRIGAGRLVQQMILKVGVSQPSDLSINPASATVRPCSSVAIVFATACALDVFVSTLLFPSNSHQPCAI